MCICQGLCPPLLMAVMHVSMYLWLCPIHPTLGFCIQNNLSSSIAS